MSQNGKKVDKGKRRVSQRRSRSRTPSRGRRRSTSSTRRRRRESCALDEASTSEGITDRNRESQGYRPPEGSQTQPDWSMQVLQTKEVVETGPKPGGIDDTPYDPEEWRPTEDHKRQRADSSTWSIEGNGLGKRRRHNAGRDDTMGPNIPFLTPVASSGVGAGSLYTPEPGTAERLSLEKLRIETSHLPTRRRLFQDEEPSTIEENVESELYGEESTSGKKSRSGKGRKRKRRRTVSSLSSTRSRKRPRGIRRQTDEHGKAKKSKTYRKKRKGEEE